MRAVAVLADGSRYAATLRLINLESNVQIANALVRRVNSVASLRSGGQAKGMSVTARLACFVRLWLL